jgi:hypothetical protein
VWQERERIKNKYGGMPPTAESVSTDPSQISPTEVGKELTGRQRMEAKLKAAEAREGVTPESIGFQPAPEIGPNIQRLEIPGQGEVRADFSGTGTIKIDFVAVTAEEPAPSWSMRSRGWLTLKIDLSSLPLIRWRESRRL